MRLVCNSNDHFYHFIKPTIGVNSIFCGEKWRNITVEDMYHFLGIILKISMEERDSGGYTAYFRKIDKTLFADLDGQTTKTLPGSAGWAWKYLSLACFRQIWSAFHPESKTAGKGGDKCYQLWCAINHVCVVKYSEFTAR